MFRPTFLWESQTWCKLYKKEYFCAENYTANSFSTTASFMESKDKVDSNEGKIESWVRLYTNSLYNWALFKTSDRECAEDLVQDTFLVAYQQQEKFNGKSSPKTWLLAILNNKISGYYRKKYKEISVKETATIANENIFSSFFAESDHWRKQEKPTHWDIEEKNLLDNQEFNQTLQSCLDKLPEHWQLAINLKYIEQKKGELICQELNISPTNFWQILHRAKLQLRKCLELNWFNA